MDYTKLFDMLSMKNVNHYYDSYMETQWFKSSDLAYLQSKKLFNLMDHCYAHVPFYRKAMLEKGLIPTDFNGISVLSEMPIIDKETIKSNYNDFIPINISSIKGVKHGQTGGTTGSMLLKRNDANSRSSVWGAFKRFENWMGYSSKDKALILMGGHVIQKKNISYYRGLGKKKDPANFPLGEWMESFVKSEMKNVEINKSISQSFNFKEIYGELSKNDYVPQESFWLKYTNPIFMDYILRFI